MKYHEWKGLNKIMNESVFKKVKYPPKESYGLSNDIHVFEYGLRQKS